MTVTPLQQLLWDLDETLDAEGSIPLRAFSGWLRGQHRGLSEDEIEVLCREAYAEVRRQYDLRLAWVTFDDPEHGEPAAPDTPLDFGTHPVDDDAPVPEPFLALLPVEP